MNNQVQQHFDRSIKDAVAATKGKRFNTREKVTSVMPAVLPFSDGLEAERALLARLTEGLPVED